MERDRSQKTCGGGTARKRAGRNAIGLRVEERGGYYHLTGTVRANGCSERIRQSLGLAATAENFDRAWDEARRREASVVAKRNGLKTCGDPVSVAVMAYIEMPRQRPLGPSTQRILKDVVRQFGLRRLNDIRADDWKAWVNQRQAGNTAASRERFISTVVAFMRFAMDHHNLEALVVFARDKKARNPRRRIGRPVEDLRADLIARLFEASHISLRAQLAAEWSTGARVSSVLYGVAVRDVILAEGREAITYRRTKNGEDVRAVLHPVAAAILRSYATWRAGMHDRDAPFFLTFRRLPYADNGRDGGGQNKTAFNAAKRRARCAVIADAFHASRVLKAEGRRDEALDVLRAARNDARLLRRVTQHWFRHLLATRMRHDLRAAMEQGGWLDERSIMGYIHDLPEERRKIVNSFDDFGKSLTQPAGLRKVTN